MILEIFTCSTLSAPLPAGTNNTTFPISYLFSLDTFICTDYFRRPALTSSQFQRADRILKVSSIAGFALAVVFLCLWQSNKNKARKNYLISFMIASSLGVTLSLLLLQFDGRPVGEKLCYDNAIPRDQSDGTSICVGQAAFLSYCTLAACLSWFAQAIDLYLTVVKGVKGSSGRYFRHYMALIFVYPAIATSIFAGMGFFGYNGMLSYCVYATFVSKTGVDLIVQYIPIFIIVLTGTALCVAVFIKVVKVWTTTSKNKTRVHASDSSTIGNNGRQQDIANDDAQQGASSKLHVVVGDGDRQSSGGKTWKKNLEGTTSLLAFLIAFVAICIVLLVYRVRNSLRSTAAARSYESWQRCIYENYDGISDSSWQSVCGDQPEYYKNVFVPLYDTNVVIVACNSIAACLPFLREFFLVCKIDAQGVDREIVRILQIRQSMARRANETRQGQGNNGNEGKSCADRHPNQARPYEVGLVSA
jgi:preprotein translocase subunit SecG